MSGNSRGKARPANGAAVPMTHFVKTKLCKHYTKGYCKFEDTCLFAHDVGELIYRPDMTKTKLCNKFMAEGTCFNENCSFAHGHGDLRQVYRSGRSTWDNRVSFVQARPAFFATSPVYFPPPQFVEMPKPPPLPRQIELTKTTRRSLNKIPAEHRHHEMMYEQEDENFVPLQSPLSLISRRWVSLVEDLLRQRRGEMLQHGRILLNRSRHEIEDGLSFLLQEPEWLMEFGPLARQYASCMPFGSEQMQ